MRLPTRVHLGPISVTTYDDGRTGKGREGKGRTGKRMDKKERKKERKGKESRYSVSGKVEDEM